MSEQNDIPRMDAFKLEKAVRKYIDANHNDVPDEFELDISQQQAKRVKNDIMYHGRKKDSRLERIFEPVKNTVLGKTKTGRLLRGVGIAAVGIVTGINLEPLTQPTPETIMTDFFTDINFWSILAAAAAAFFGYLKTKTGARLDAVIDDAEGGLVLFAKFKQKESDGGTQVTEAEKDLLIEHFGQIFEKQAKKAA